MSASYMMMVDSIITAGKLPIIECDSRTVYFDSKSTNPALLGEWGKTYTLKESIEALKRDFANMMIKGAGLWWYDMYGGWFDDPEIYSMIKTAKAEWDKAVQKNVESNSRIAFIVGDDIATTLAYNFDGTSHFVPFGYRRRLRKRIRRVPYSCDERNRNAKGGYKQIP